jgi:putative oxidoreductase
VLTAPSQKTIDLALLIARVTAGVAFIPHGAQHLFGMFGGSGIARFAQNLGPVAYLVAVGEVFGGLALIVGLGSRFSAASLIVIMGGAIRVHARNGWFMNWSGRQSGEGFEYHLLMIALLLITLIAGPGRHSLARVLRLPKAMT